MNASNISRFVDYFHRYFISELNRIGIYRDFKFTVIIRNAFFDYISIFIFNRKGRISFIRASLNGYFVGFAVGSNIRIDNGYFGNGYGRGVDVYIRRNLAYRNSYLLF